MQIFYRKCRCISILLALVSLRKGNYEKKNASFCRVLVSKANELKRKVVPGKGCCSRASVCAQTWGDEQLWRSKAKSWLVAVQGLCGSAQVSSRTRRCWKAGSSRPHPQCFPTSFPNITPFSFWEFQRTAFLFVSSQLYPISHHFFYPFLHF